MKKMLLLVELVASPAFAQDEEIQIELESGGEGSNRAIAGYPDKSVWMFYKNRSDITCCWVD